MLEDLCESRIVIKTLQKMHCPSSEIEDTAQDLLLSWIEKPEKLMKAADGGYIKQYVFKACRYKVDRVRSEQIEYVDIDSLIR